MNESVAVKNPLGTEPVGKLIVRYAVPSIISTVVNSLYNMVDQVFIGQGVGYLGNAATNVVFPLMTIVMALAQMLGDGAAAYMSLNLGKKKEEAAARGAANAMAASVFIGIILAILFEIFMEPLCKLFGATENSLPYAMEYGRIVSLGYIFSCIATSYGGMIRADGRPKTSMVGLLVGCITNIILDPIFIFVFGWGVKGAAFATVIGQFLNAVIYIYAMTRCKTIVLKKEYLKPSGKVLPRVCALGVSSLLTQLAGVVVMLVMNNSLVKYGALSRYGADIPLAAFGIVTKVNQLATCVLLGLAVGSQPITGYNYGSGQFDRVKKVYRYTMTFGIVFMCVAWCVFQLFPSQIISIFGKESDLYMEFAVKCLRLNTIACPLIAVSAITGIFFQSIGKPVQSTILSLLRQILVFVPAVLIFSAIWGINGLLWAPATSDIISAVIAATVIAVYWKKIFAKGGAKHE